MRVLLRPMMPLRVSPVADLSGKSILLLSGAMDPIASADSTARLIAAFGKAGARWSTAIYRPATSCPRQISPLPAAGWLLRILPSCGVRWRKRLAPQVA